jgi:hypothetical protein
LQIPDTISSKGTGFNHSSTETKHHTYCHIKSKEVQAIENEEDEDERRTHFCNWFLQAVHDRLLEPKLTLFTEEGWFHLSRYINSQNNRYWSSINKRQTSEVPLLDQKIGV